MQEQADFRHEKWISQLFHQDKRMHEQEYLKLTVSVNVQTQNCRTIVNFPNL